MWPYLEREFRVAARSWDALASVLLIASALGFIFAESYAAGLAAVNFVTVALYAYTQILREEELGTLDGLRLLRQPEKLVAAKFIVLFVTSLATSAVYSAVYFATSLRPPELWLAPPTAAYFAAASTAAALLSTAAKSGVSLSMTLTAALILGYSISIASGRLDAAVLATPAAAVLAITALSRTILH